MTEEESVRKSKRLKEILEDPIFIETCAGLKDLWLSRIVNSKPEDVEVREVYYYQIRALESVLTKIRNNIRLDIK